MGEIYQKKNSEGWELLLVLPRLGFIVIETLVDNQLTTRSRVVSLCNSAKMIVAHLRATR